MIEMNNYYYSLNDIFQKTPYKLETWVEIRDGLPESSYAVFTELDEDTITKYLLDPLMLRWSNDRICLAKTDYDATAVLFPKLRLQLTLPIWTKLNTILPKYKELYSRYQALINTMDNGGIKTTATNESITRHNDTPNSNSDYGADKYTSDINKTTNTSSASLNKLDEYDLVKDRLENLPQQIINEMKEFEIWM